ncbi:hypothetical protein AMTR_s00020p00178140 [Amborella trichopoda]|uniref:Uncharacterized protein n=1 Tax=Amborella trichopoda TaxID=13333 RepID=W1PVY6_AMBTC|nr:hypothetical protein AMTR_s00020p00178140 [Amborella trichopoda]
MMFMQQPGCKFKQYSKRSKGRRQTPYSGPPSICNYQSGKCNGYSVTLCSLELEFFSLSRVIASMLSNGLGRRHLPLFEEVFDISETQEVSVQHVLLRVRGAEEAYALEM